MKVGDQFHALATFIPGKICLFVRYKVERISFNPLNAELNPIRHLLALVGARHFVHVSRVRVKFLIHIIC